MAGPFPFWHNLFVALYNGSGRESVAHTAGGGAVPTYVVYVDEVFLENLVLDLALLYTAARLAHTGVRPRRLLVAGALGGLYALTLFWPGGRFLAGAAGKVLASAAMVGVAFVPLPWPRFFLLLGSLYLAAFASGGAALALAYFLAPPGGRLWDIDFVLARQLAPATAAALPVLWFLAKAAERGWRHLALDACRMGLAIHWRGQRVQVEALVDTGNCLEDPVSGHPVVVVEGDALRSLFPEGLLPSGGIDLSDLDRLGGTELACRLRLIPFRALGQGGMMVGFRPDQVEIVAGGQRQAVREVVVGIAPRPLDPALNCRALVHPRLLAEILA